MNDIMNIADYIILKSIESQKPITNLALQKYLYFINAKSLVERGQPIFDYDLEKWKFGPVASDVYHEYKHYRAKPITKVSNHEKVVFDKNFNISFVENTFDPNDICEADKILIDELLPILQDYDDFELVDMTHRHSDWKNDEQKILNGERNLKYSNEKIRKYFSDHEDAQIWLR